MAFVPHMTFLEAHRLKIGDKIDHRKLNGKFAIATIIHHTPQKGTVKLHYDGQSAQYDTFCSYTSELHRFALATSISRRPAHRLTTIRKGSFVEINNPQHPGWRKAEVVKCSSSSGQIQVRCRFGVHIEWHRWVHLDDEEQVDAYGVHSGKGELHRLPILMAAKRGYRRMVGEAKKRQCSDEIIERVFGGDIVSFLLKHASSSELQQMRSIINAPAPELQLPTTTSTMSVSGMERLPQESIENIASFLGRADIASLKVTSYAVSMAITDIASNSRAGSSAAEKSA